MELSLREPSWHYNQWASKREPMPSVPMNFTLYPVLLAGPGDDEQFDLPLLPVEAAEDVRIEKVSDQFAQGTFDLFREKLGTDRLADAHSVRFALVHRYPDPIGSPQSVRSEETVQLLASCLRLVRPMRQRVLLMRGNIRNGQFDVNHFSLPSSHYGVEVPEVQKLFKLRNRDADQLRACAPEFLRAMRGEFWKFRMAVQFHDLGHFQSEHWEWKARFLLWCSAIESIYTSHGSNDHKGSLVAKSRIKWFIEENTSIYAPGDISTRLNDPHLTIGDVVGDLYELRNIVAHGDKIPDRFFRDTLRQGVNSPVRKTDVLLEAASFIIRASLLKILQENLLDHFADAGPAEQYFGAQGLTRRALAGRSRI